MTRDISMIFPPIVARELRVLAGNARFHWGRALVAGFALLVCLQWFGASGAGMNVGAVGRSSLGLLTAVGLVIALASVVITADCISHERREGTLSLLFLSTMKGRDVVLGKLAALGLVVVFALMGFAPALMLTLLPGGVTGGEVARTALALVNISFVSLCAGVFVSVFARTQLGAMLGAFTLLALINGLPFVIEVIGRTMVAIPYRALSPVAGLSLAGDAAYSDEQFTFWLTLGVGHGEGWLLLFGAMAALGRNWRMLYEPRARISVGAETRRLVGAPRVLVQGRENQRRAFAPVARAMLRLPHQMALAWVAALISVIGSIGNALVMSRTGLTWAGAGFAVTFGCVSSGLFAFLAARFLFESRRSGELELLLVTPVGTKGILREQKLALLRMFRGPLYLVLVGAVLVAACSIGLAGGNDILGLALGVGGIANMVLGILAVSCVAMSQATRANSLFGLIGYAVGLVEVLPVVMAYLLAAPVCVGLGLAGLAPLLVALLLVVKNIGFTFWAAGRLQREFRTGRESALRRNLRRWFSAAPVALPTEHPQAST